MKCPECNSSRFFELSHGQTMMGSHAEPPHVHDPNSHTRLFVCENNHKIEIYYTVACPVEGCEYGK